MRVGELPKQWVKIIPPGTEIIPVFFILPPSSSRVHDNPSTAYPNLVPCISDRQINPIVIITSIHQNIDTVIRCLSCTVINNRASKHIFCREPNITEQRRRKIGIPLTHGRALRKYTIIQKNCNPIKNMIAFFI